MSLESLDQIKKECDEPVVETENVEAALLLNEKRMKRMRRRLRRKCKREMLMRERRAQARKARLEKLKTRKISNTCRSRNFASLEDECVIDHTESKRLASTLSPLAHFKDIELLSQSAHRQSSSDSSSSSSRSNTISRTHFLISRSSSSSFCLMSKLDLTKNTEILKSETFEKKKLSGAFKSFLLTPSPTSDLLNTVSIQHDTRSTESKEASGRGRLVYKEIVSRVLKTGLCRT